MAASEPRRRRASRVAGLPVGLLVVAALTLGALGSLATGNRPDVGLPEIWTVLVGADVTAGEAGSDARIIFWETRLPRTLAAALLGINLAVAGLLLQAMTRNPLASPTILGINQGAALGLVLTLAFPAALERTRDAMAMAGALGAGVLTFAIAGGFRGRIDRMRLVLGGVAVGALAYAAVRLAYTLEDNLARDAVRWTIGDLSDMRLASVVPLAGWCALGVCGSWLLAQRLNLMSLGDASARGLGADPRWTLVGGTLLAALLTGASVAAAGPIGFVGLVVPHVARAFWGGDHRLLIPTGALLGAALMLVADTASKALFEAEEVPIGIVTVLIGAPYFLYLTLTSEALE
ncbi:MAG: iron ABC transporter permease [Acidobacteriota bacterium]